MSAEALDKRPMRIKEAAQYAGVNPSTLRRWEAEGLRFLRPNGPGSVVLVVREELDAS